jgi:hypothetical protein
LTLKNIHKGVNVKFEPRETLICAL